MTYKEKLLDPRWQKKRLQVFDRDNFCCKMCDSEKDTLQVHHLKYKGNPWDVDLSDLKTLCLYCHEVVELCKSAGFKFHNSNRIDRPNKILYLLNSIQEGNLNTVVILDNSSGRFQFTSQMLSKEFVEILLKTF